MPATKLAPLRSRLSDLRRRRTFLRLATGWSGFIAAVLACLLLAFAIDVLLEMGRLERVVSLGLLLFAGVVAWRWLLRPFLGLHESDLDMALLVEHRLKIDSDLVAAIQFESPEAPRWGSTQLEGAVIDYVADFGNSVNVFEGLPVREFRKRLIALGIVALVWLPLVILLPRHLPAFAERLFLGSSHYPTATQIAEIRINNVNRKPGTVRLPHGSPIRFSVVATGVLPADGEIRLKPQLRPDAGLWTRLVEGLSAWAFSGSAPMADAQAAVVKLEPVPAASLDPPPTLPKGVTEFAVLTGQTLNLTEPLEFQIFVGDAWTDPRAIDVTPLPVVTLKLQPTPPEYARGVTLPPAQPGSQVLSVIEGSQVDLSVVCTNKSLESASVTIGEQSYPMVAADDNRQTWQLPSDLKTFQNVTAPFSFTVQVVDVDSLSLERPLAGHIRLLADREPRITAAIVTERVIPTARPTIGYKATDDFGLAELRIRREIERADGQLESVPDLVVVKVDAAKQSVLQLPPPPGLEGLRLDLRPLKLEKGDKLRVTLEAVDYRGQAAGKTARSETLVFQVTDQSGILEGLTEADQKSARQLDTIIQRQLGIGETR